MSKKRKSQFQVLKDMDSLRRMWLGYLKTCPMQSSAPGINLSSKTYLEAKKSLNEEWRTILSLSFSLDLFDDMYYVLHAGLD